MSSKFRVGEKALVDWQTGEEIKPVVILKVFQDGMIYKVKGTNGYFYVGSRHLKPFPTNQLPK